MASLAGYGQEIKERRGRLAGMVLGGLTDRLDDQARRGQCPAVGRRRPVGSLVGHGHVVVLDGTCVVLFGQVRPGELGRDKGMMHRHREAAAGHEDAGGLGDNRWHVVDVVQAHEGDDEICRPVREGQLCGVGDEGRGAARVGECGFDQSAGRVGADDSVAGRGQGTNGQAQPTVS